MKKFIDELKFSQQGLIPAIIQDDKSGKVLTLCYMNTEALRQSLKQGRVYVFRRSKGALMLKGETSGHIQSIRSVYIDCEGNSILFKVEQKIAACHAGYFTCYFRKLNDRGEIEVREEKVFEPEKVY